MNETCAAAKEVAAGTKDIDLSNECLDNAAPSIVICNINNAAPSTHATCASAACCACCWHPVEFVIQIFKLSLFSAILAVAPPSRRSHTKKGCTICMSI
eukprot:365987-Chlamydomonas_euryale.AAC.18